MSLEEWLLVLQVAAVAATLLAVGVALWLGKRDREAADDRAAEDRRIADKRAADDRRDADERAAEDRRAADERAQRARDEADARAEADRVAARELREEQARPYVVLSLEQGHRDDPNFVDLVVRNYGATAALNIEVKITPQPVTTIGDGSEQALAIPAVIPMLAPGQEWRTLWDTGYDRGDADLPDRHDASTTYTDSRGQPLSSLSVLDFGVFKPRRYVGLYGVHDIAKTLRELNQRDESRERRAQDERRTRRELEDSRPTPETQVEGQ